MVEVKQFMGGTWDTEDYPYVLLNPQKNVVHGRFSTLEKAHKGRLDQALREPDEIGLMLYNEKTKEFIEWRRKELQIFEQKRPHYD
jgi:hypothetical protein